MGKRFKNKNKDKREKRDAESNKVVEQDDAELGKRNADEEEEDDENEENENPQWDGSSGWAYQNIFLETFYKRVLNHDMPTEESFQMFLDCIKTRLPTNFRVNIAYPNYQEFEHLINDQAYLKKHYFGLDKLTEEDIRVAKEKYQFDIESLNFMRCPWHKQVYELNANRQGLKKSPALKQLHELIQRAADCGLITRQELVSMIPVMYLDLQGSDAALDMCAAPGSKTAQMLEIIDASNAGKSATQVNGGVVANDLSSKRAWMLTHQIKRINTACMAVINHEGQFIPTLSDVAATEAYDKKYYFDKVLVDVPCSGDGAIRKIPQRWKRWGTTDGIDLHPVQLSLLQRAVQLTKVGGLIVYSTCSLNPIEVVSYLNQERGCCSRDATKGK